MSFQVGDRVFARLVGHLPNVRPSTVVEVKGPSYMVQIDEPPATLSQPVEFSEENLSACPFGSDVRTRPVGRGGQLRLPSFVRLATHADHPVSYRRSRPRLRPGAADYESAACL